MLNDLSGSPKVLSLVIKGVLSRGYKAELFTSKNNYGFLSGIDGVKYHYVNYGLSGSRAFNILRFIVVQFRYFFGVLSYAGSRGTQIYINTMLPLGALLGAAMIRKRIICHIHEFPGREDKFHKISLKLIKRFAYRIILVSDFQYRLVTVESSRKRMIYNALPEDFVKRALSHTPIFKNNGNILMACSLRKYKGVDIFIEVAEKLPLFTFTLLLNSGKEEAEIYFSTINMPSNITLITGSGDIAGFYEKANLVLNLSQPDLFIETFGLTILEAMTYGIPAIVPETGGITELVDDGVNGFRVDTSKPDKVVETIINIFSDEAKYYRLSESSRAKSKLFSYTRMIDQIMEVAG